MSDSLPIMNKAITSETLAVMFLDIVDYTRTTARLKRDKVTELQELFDELSLPTFLKYNGNVVKKIGDAFLITFKSPTNALLCGIELQNEFKKSKKLKIRIGIHTGEVIVKDNDIYGDAVNTTARLQNLAKPGHIVFSGAVFLVINKNEIPAIHLGQKRLKGLPHPIRCFRVKSQYDEILKRRRIRRKKFKKVKRRVTGLIVLIIILIFLALFGGFIAGFLASLLF
jgi:class 3 adenylate cyclase